ncbi:hypothetical protein HT094_01265 [Shewanella sp. ZOR0012]|uniref:FimV/HubP family polar landmark protein n=1 Tax=Shewanella sp. ZOR0012 TaxID=1339231 RepID=UPI000648E61C|nr:FimV/HubP family polar landmark protein [Shewanella sp. ZOR0012]NSM23073.1 hypothetical protein [Shewanella sp. ZOR0012]
MSNVLKLLGLLALSYSFSSLAQVSHVSFNGPMFELGSHPKMRVNVVTDDQDMTRLEFVLRQSTREEKLMALPVNRFMLLLFGLENVTDPKARLLVREYRVDRWYEVKNLPLFENAGSGESSTLLAKTTVVKPIKASKTEANSLIANDKATAVKSTKNATEVNLVTAETEVAPIVVAAASESAVVPRSSGFTFPGDKLDAEVSKLQVSTTDKPTATAQSTPDVNTRGSDKVESSNVPETQTQKSMPEAASSADNSVAISVSSGQCTLDYHNETLWRISNRYAVEWQVSVYGAMLAIHDANPKAFSKNRINALKKDATLYCPSTEILARYPDAKAAKASFEDREAGK